MLWNQETVNPPSFAHLEFSKTYLEAQPKLLYQVTGDILGNQTAKLKQVITLKTDPTVQT